MSNFQGHYIGGSYVKGSSKDSISVVNKFSQAEMASIPLAGEAEIEMAFNSATEALPVLRKMSGGERSEILTRLADLVGENADMLADLIVAEAGKPIGYSKGEIARCKTTLQIASREALGHTGEMIPMEEGVAVGKTAFTKRFPLGIIVGISPFNFPLNLALHKIAPALAAGCPIILKPSPLAPLSCFAFAELCQKAGVPKGAINILLCDDSTAAKLSTDRRAAMVTFTGSPAVGWHIKQSVAKAKVQLELGGNAGALIDEGTDLKMAAEQIAMGAFLYSGQICISTQRVYAVASVFEEFKKHLVHACSQIKCGNPTEPTTTVGPLIAKVHYDRILGWIKEACDEGAETLSGGKGLENNIIEPTILTNTNSSMKVQCEEVFGPLLILESVKSFDEGITQLNNTRFGLQAGVFTPRIDRMKQAFEELDVGGVMMNNVPGYRVDHMPYGGIKDSGLGREGLRYAMDEMTEPRILVY